MATIHFLNVKEGDCSIIQHISGHVTVIDVCNASISKPNTELQQPLDSIKRALMNIEQTSGNFNQKHWPVNPIDYMEERKINRVFRYIQTHPDMDHMDGIESFFKRFGPINFWDTANNREITAWDTGLYRESDWKFYTDLREGRLKNPPKRHILFSNDKGKYWNKNKKGEKGGDGLRILAPTKELMEEANESKGNYNDSSYVLLYSTGGRKAVFAGDSHDKTWEHVLSEHGDLVQDIDLLIAPHHGRDSGRKYKFLDHLNPSLSLLGNAPSEHINYGEWNRRGLWHITNNQANSVVVDIRDDSWILHVTNKTYAEKEKPNAQYSEHLKAWEICEIPRST